MRMVVHTVSTKTQLFYEITVLLCAHLNQMFITSDHDILNDL